MELKENENLCFLVCRRKAMTSGDFRLQMRGRDMWNMGGVLYYIIVAPFLPFVFFWFPQQLLLLLLVLVLVLVLTTV